MKIEFISSDNIKVYVYEQIDDSIDIRYAVKNIINGLKYELKLRGYYGVYVYYRSIGLFLNLIKIDDGLYKDSIDLKIILNDDNEVYYMTNNYSIIEKLSNIRYVDGNFYCIVDDYFDDILNKVEFGKFIFGYGTNDLIKNSIVI